MTMQRLSLVLMGMLTVVVMIIGASSAAAADGNGSMMRDIDGAIRFVLVVLLLCIIVPMALSSRLRLEPRRSKPPPRRFVARRPYAH